MTTYQNMPLPFPDPARDMDGRMHRHPTDTEAAAARAVAPRAGTQRAAVLRTLTTVGPDGATDNELHFIHRIGARPLVGRYPCSVNSAYAAFLISSRSIPAH